MRAHSRDVLSAALAVAAWLAAPDAHAVTSVELLFPPASGVIRSTGLENLTPAPGVQLPSTVPGPLSIQAPLGSVSGSTTALHAGRTFGLLGGQLLFAT
ncbi:MAG TPA: hypothetical protein VFX28_13370, partial [Methylomirabilota bacterium]|nr:hypothetical protein [Methylomirabilota bacterium]